MNTKIRTKTYDASAAVTASDEFYGAQQTAIVDVSAVTGTSVDVTMDDIGTVRGAHVTALTASGNAGENMKVTWATNVVTVADNSSDFDLSSLDTLIITAFGYED